MTLYPLPMKLSDMYAFSTLSFFLSQGLLPMIKPRTPGRCICSPIYGSILVPLPQGEESREPAGPRHPPSCGWMSVSLQGCGQFCRQAESLSVANAVLAFTVQQHFLQVCGGGSAC